MNEGQHLPYDPTVTPTDEPRAHEPRLVVLREAHFGIGLRWATDDYMPFPLHLSFALPFVTFELGIGKRRAETVSEK